MKGKHLLALSDWPASLVKEVVDYGIRIKENPKKYSNKLSGRTLLMIFEKPSLRTRLSFEVAMTQMGGHAIHYNVKDSPLGKKESIADTAKTASRFVDIIMARLYKQEDIEDLARNSIVPVINALTDTHHPCQALGDLMTIQEKKGKLKGLKLAYYGDGNNNVTYSLLHAASLAGIDMTVACPEGKAYEPSAEILGEAMDFARKSGSKIRVTHGPKEAAEGADVLYTDSWMSYHIPPEEEKKRLKALEPYQVTEEIMYRAKKDAVFMHCLPAMRGMEVSAEVIDGPKSIVFDQAENRLHIQKAIILKLLGKI